MSSCVHHWRQDDGGMHAPFTCILCGESKVMETDFYKIFDERGGRTWDKLGDRRQDQPLPLAAA